jgi:hydrogenase/urease accessory protein HupE
MIIMAQRYKAVLLPQFFPDLCCMEFSLYFRMGITHITDIAGYDHMLFLLALCASYTLRNWKHLAWLVTAFTVGHATTLALAAWDIFPINRPLVEVLIAASIGITALYNLVWN